MRAALEFMAALIGQTLLVTLIVGAVLGMALGVVLLFDSARALRWNARLSRWVSTREATQPLDRPRDIKRWVYRSHRVVGLLVVAGALFALDALNFSFQTAALVRAFRDLGDHSLLAVTFEAMRLFLIIGNLAALGAGAVLCFRPSLLKGIEAWADRSYTTRESSKTLDEMHFQPDRWVSAHPRIAGLLMLAGSAYVLVTLALLPLL